MKVYFVGSHSTGKTTCARYVSEKYGLPMITEVARAVLSEKELHIDSLRYDMKLVDQYQTDIFHRQINEEMNHIAKNNKGFVSDRSFDCLAYAAQHTRVLPKLITSSHAKSYVESLRDKGVFIFFVRPSKVTLKQDGVRESINWDGVVAIDAMVKFMLEMWELPHFQINMDNMQERVQLIDGVLSLNQ